MTRLKSSIFRMAGERSFWSSIARELRRAPASGPVGLNGRTESRRLPENVPLPLTFEEDEERLFSIMEL